MSSEKEEKNEQKVRKHKKWPYIVGIIILIVIFAIGANMDVVVKWFVPDNQIPSIVLNHPNDNQTIGTNTTYFNWTGTDGDGDPLSYVWYCDALNTFSSPFYQFNNTGAVHNSTEGPFMDGYWYWRVEVTDGEDTNVSETRRFKILTDAGNGWPNVTSGQVTPMNGDTNTNFVYTVVFTDPDNDTADYVRVYIDEVMYNMTESNPLDDNTTDGKTYIYTTTLGVGLHNYSFTCSDGTAFNLTTVSNGPFVTQAVVPPSGGGGGPSTGYKMNKITIQAHNLETYPTGAFEGNIVITDEGYGIQYEVYWYIFLLDSYDNEIAYDSGAIALDTTVFVPYVILVPENISYGTYRLLAKTFDEPREKITSTEIGRDTISVQITEKPIGQELIEKVQSDSILLFLLILGAFFLPLLAWKWKKGIYLVAFIGLLLLICLVFNLVAVHFYSIIAIIMVMVGCFFFTKYTKHGPIQNPRTNMIIGGVLLFLGIVLYFLPYT